MSKRINTDTKMFFDGIVKESRGMIADTAYSMRDGQYRLPAFIKLNDEEAFAFYRFNPWMGSTINRIVSDCAKVQYEIVPKDKNKKVNNYMKKRIQKIVDFLEFPNKNGESFVNIREKYIRDRLVYGRGAMELVRGQERRIEEIYAIASRYLEIRSDDSGNIPDKKAYKYEAVRGKPQYYDFDEIAMMIDIPITESLYGLKKADYVASTVAADILRCMYNDAFFTNGAEANGVLSLDGLGRAELEKFRQHWESNHKGAKMAHRTAFTNVPVNWIKMAVTNRDMQFGEYGQELKMKIWAIFNMQPQIMGDMPKGGFVKADYMSIYKDGAIKPILHDEEGIYTRLVIQDGFGYDDLKLKFTSLDLEDAKTQSDIDNAQVASGIIVINEARRNRGLAEVPWGDTPLSVLPGGNQVDPNTGKIIPPSQQNANTSGSKVPKLKPTRPKKSLDDVFDEIDEICLESAVNKTELDRSMLVNYGDKYFTDPMQMTLCYVYADRICKKWDSVINRKISFAVKLLREVRANITTEKMYETVA